MVIKIQNEIKVKKQEKELEIQITEAFEAEDENMIDEIMAGVAEKA